MNRNLRHDTIETGPVARRRGPSIDELRLHAGSRVDEHIAVVGPRYSGASYLSNALAQAFNDRGEGNPVQIIRSHRQSHPVRLRGDIRLHTITIYDGFIPAGGDVPGLRIISVSGLG